MRLTNTNKLFTDEFIRKVIRFCRPSGISNFDVMVKNSKKNFGGMAYYTGCGYHKTSNPFITVSIGTIKFPLVCDRKNQRGGYLPFKCFTKEEILVKVMAHELRHLWQSKHPRGWRVWGARGQFSERDADAYAIHKMREFRRIGLVINS